MNPENYASLPASRRLVEAGIVLETEAIWEYHDPCSDPKDPAWNQYGEWELVHKPYKIGQMHNRQLPAPLMAEVWRELPKNLLEVELLVRRYLRSKSVDLSIVIFLITLMQNIDKSIDLLIWVRKEKKDD